MHLSLTKPRYAGAVADLVKDAGSRHSLALRESSSGDRHYPVVHMHPVYLNILPLLLPVTTTTAPPLRNAQVREAMYLRHA